MLLIINYINYINNYYLIMLFVLRVFFFLIKDFCQPWKNVANMCFFFFFLIGVYLLNNNKHFLLNAQIYAHQGKTQCH